MRHASRRDFVRALLSGAAAHAVLPRAGWAQQAAAAPPPITVTRLSDQLAVLSGDGGNVGLVISGDGLLMIDGGLADRAAELAQAIAKIDRRRVQVVINTHYHFDHVGSNERLGRTQGGERVRIIAHENVRKRLAERFTNEAFGRTFEPLVPEGLPTETYSMSGRLEFGDNRLDYSHVPPSHTDGDTFVFLPGENAVHTGDLLFLGRYPVIDYSAGGSLAAMVAALDTIDRVIDDTTRIIPGHGPLSTRADLRAARDAWSVINGRIESMVRDGRTLEQVLVAAPTKEFDARLGTTTRDSFIRQTYGGLRRQ